MKAIFAIARKDLRLLLRDKGEVFFTDIPNHRIHKIALDGKVSLFAEDTGGANGLMFGPDGRLALDEMNRAWVSNGRTDLPLPPLSELALGVGQGSVFIARDAAGRIDPSVTPDAIETPRDNATNNRVIVSSLTGRSRILKPALP